MNGSAIKIISASAGSGKTFKLTQELLSAIDCGVPPEKVLATTFTNKAAAELIERVRGKLFENGRAEHAQRILDGYLGTVNSVCGRILREFAFECGLSPVQDVLPETEAKNTFDRAISSIIEKYAFEIEPIAKRFGMKERDANSESSNSYVGYGFGAEDWRETIKAIIDHARNNNIDPGDLKDSARKSWETLKSIIHQPSLNRSSSELDDELKAAINDAYGVMKSNGDMTSGTAGVLKRLKDFFRLMAKGVPLSWHDWVELSSKLNPCKASQSAYEKVRLAAGEYIKHPQFHQDLETFINVIFDCAGAAIKEFQDFKRSNGLVDFVDQEKRTLEFLQNGANQKRIKEKFEVMLVDEFQDTSPIQLALFLKFAEVAEKSIWVGDQKQAIYGFRGTDPALMDSAIEHLTGNNRLEILSDSWRTRSSLLEFTNTVFRETFGRHKIPSERVVLNPKVMDLPDQEIPLHVWRLSRANQADETQSLASAIKHVAKSLHLFKVKDKQTGASRDLRLGDIAILCRTTGGKKRVARALEEAGIRVTMPRDGLLSTPESTLGVAALRYLVDKNDTLAVAEIMHFMESPSGTPKWFTDWLAPDKPELGPQFYIMDRLDALRPNLINWSPSEALEAALNSVGIHETALRWGDGVHRIGNVEKLRGLALKYEAQSLVNRTPATPAGLVTFLCQKVRGTEMDTQPEGQDENAVQVFTYHGAKGLEWPMVVMFELDKIYQPRLFGASLSSDMSNFDVTNPLKDRWVRYWPWPFGSYQKVDSIESKITKSSEYLVAQEKELKEAIRLLYVGMTRARDYLVFAVGSKPDKKTGALGATPSKWLDLLRNEDGQKLVTLPADVSKKLIQVGKQPFTARVQDFSPSQIQSANLSNVAYISERPTVRITHLPLRLVPSDTSAVIGGTNASIKNQVNLGGRIKLSGTVDMEMLGDAVHAFLAVDKVSWIMSRREEMAIKILRNWKIDALTEQSLIEASNRLWSFLEITYGKDCKYHREWPINLKENQQKARGWIDLLIETPMGYVVIDHKSFPGSESQCDARALEYAAQLAIYRKAIEKATGRSVVATMIHLPITGRILDISTT